MTDIFHRIATATTAGNINELSALAMELAAQVAGLESLRDADVARRAGQSRRTKRYRDARNVESRDVTLQSVTERDVASPGVTVTPPPSPSSSFPTPHITPSPSPTPQQQPLPRVREEVSDEPPPAEPVAPPGELFDAVPELLARIPEGSRTAWAAEIDVAKDGMHAAAMTEAQIQQACRDYLGNGNLNAAAPSLRHFRAYLANAVAAAKKAVEPPTKPARTIAVDPRFMDDGKAGRFYAQIRALIVETPNPGRGVIRNIPRQSVVALGNRAFTAYQQIGGAPRFLDQGEKLGFLQRDFEKAYHEVCEWVPADEPAALNGSQSHATV